MADNDQSLSEADDPDLYRLLAENVKDYAIFVIDGNRRVQTWTAGARRLLGYTEADILGQPADIFYTPEDRAAGVPHQEIEQALRTGRGEDDRWHLKKDGSRFWSSGVMTPLFDEGKTLRGFAKIMRDRTELKRSDEERLQIETLKASILETSLDGIVTIDSEDRIVEWNPAAERIFGYRKSDVLGRLMGELLVPPALREAHYSGLAHYLATGEGPVLHRRIDVTALRSDGTEFPIELAIVPTSTDQEPRLFTAHVRDITDRHEHDRRRTLRLAVSQALAEAGSLSEAATRALSALCEGLGWDLGNLWVLNAGGDGLQLEKSWKSQDERFPQFVEASRTKIFRKGEGLPGQVWETARPLTISDVTADQQVSRALVAAKEGLHGAVAFPVIARSEVVGVMEFFNRNARAVDEDLLELLTSIGAQFGQFIERRRSEEALRASEERFRRAADAAPVLIWVAGTDKSCQWFNRPWLEFTGRTIDQEYGYGWAAGMHPGDFDRCVGIYSNCFDARREFQMEYRLRRHDGEYRWMLSHGIPLHEGPGGEFSGYIGSCIDITDRKLGESALQENEAWLRLALEAGNMGTWEWDVRTGRLRWSQNLESIHGLEAGTFDGTFEAFQRLVHSDDRRTLEASLQESLTKGTTFESEFRIIRPNGEIGWMLGRGKAYLSEAGEPLRMVGVGMEVTDRHRVEEELSRISLESERRRRLYETILANTPDLAYVFDLEHRFTYANEILLRMWGRSWDEAIGKNCLELGYEPWHAAMHDREIEQVVATKQPIRGEVPFTGTNGRRIYDYILVPVIGNTGEVEAVAGTTRDVTERKRDEADARFLADASAALTDLTDPDSTLRKVARLAVPHFADCCAVDLLENDELRRVAVAHIEPATVELAHEYHSHVPAGPSDPSGAWQILRTGRSELIPEITDDSLNETVKEPDRLRLLRKLGVRSYIGVALKVRDNVLGVLTFVAAESDRRYDKRDLDVAEKMAQRVAIALENSRLYREVHEAHRRKDEFLAMLAHELRNPLAPIKSGLDLLQMTGTDQEVVGLMSGQVEHLVRLVDDLLDVSRILRGRVELRRSPIRLDRVVQRAVETVRPMFDAQRQEFSLSMPSEPLLLQGDLVRLTQVLSNLLNNASKYTEPGGRISLSVERDSDEAVIRVSDSGTGIEPHLLPHVFDLFTQSTRTIDRAQGGLGLGLTIVKNLLEMHDGTVSVKSEGIGKGSEFTVRLPMALVPVQAADAQPEPVPVTSCRILVVDDNVPAAKLLVRLIDKFGCHETVTAHDGEGALAAAEAYKPDLILLDIGLPKMDGYQVAKQLRANPKFAQTLLVALTGYGTDEDRRKAAEAGFDEHVTKPPSIEVLKQVLCHPKLKP